ncbi:MAG TPA: C10 family peptidase [Bacteroidales bacterium]|nr:C10 family peptidase [Bacteroidales bacterium]
MKKKLLTFITLLIVTLIGNLAFPAPVSLEKAQTVAINFLKVDAKSSTLSLVYTRKSSFYVFSHANGFVIIAADDRVEPILGYSTESTFLVPENNTDTIVGNNFWGWMRNYEAQIAYVVENNISATEEITASWQLLIDGNSQNPKGGVGYSTVDPLLTTTWNQTWPYNAMCPANPSGPGGHVYTGCVATAMAQILKYHNYPDQGLGSYGYTWGSYPYSGADFGATTYNWTNMPDNITSLNNDVATIMYHAAVSVGSMWGPGSTGVGYSSDQDPMTRAFLNYFKMAYSTISYVEKSAYTDDQWNTLIQGELLESRPVYYRGDGVGSHAFVCDGVDDANMYHFNFGWGGAYNGYYTVASINPGGYNFTSNQDAIIGIQPNDGSTLVEDATWGSVEKNSNVCIPDAITLTIDPGATISFGENCKLQVFGQITSIGDSSNYVVFTAADTSLGWSGIKFDNGYMGGEVMADNDTSRLSYTQVEYSQNSGIYCKSFGKVLIDHSKINNNYVDGWGGGISVWYTAINITNSELYKNHATIKGGVFILIITTIYLLPLVTITSTTVHQI